MRSQSGYSSQRKEYPSMRPAKPQDGIPSRTHTLPAAYELIEPLRLRRFMLIYSVLVKGAGRHALKNTWQYKRKGLADK